MGGVACGVGAVGASAALVLFLLLEPRPEHNQDEEEFRGGSTSVFCCGGVEFLEEFVEVLLHFHVVLVDHLAELTFCGGGGEVELDEHDDGIGHADKIENWEAPCRVDVK